jgi:photosystem II stability/assembly factor-like uncharacterized protein
MDVRHADSRRSLLRLPSRKSRRRVYRWTLLSTLLAAALAPAARAADGVWAPVGPQGSGGGLTVLAADSRIPSTVYTSAGGDLLKSSDGGNSWAASGEGLGGALVLALGIDPADPNTLYVQASDGSVFRSDDAAGHFTPVLGPAPNPDAEFLAVGPGIVLHTRSFALSKSLDRGATWTEIYPRGISGVLQPTVNPADARKLYFEVSYPAGGLMQSADGGATWASTGPVIQGSPFFAGAGVLLGTVTAAPSTLYASVAGSFYRSTDNGASWVQLSAPGQFGIMAVDPLSAASIYGLSGGLYSGFPAFSADGGVSWNPVNGLPPPFFGTDSGGELSGIAFVNGSHTAVAGSSAYGPVFLEANQASWFPAGAAGLPTGFVHFLKFGPNMSATLLVGTDTGLSRSADDGATWTTLVARQPPELDDLEFDAVSPANLFGAAGSHGQGIFRSSDGGQTWTQAGTDPRVAQTTTLLRRGVALFAGCTGIQRSIDGGLTWVEVLAAAEPSPAAHPPALRVVDRLIGDPVQASVAYALVEIAAAGTASRRLELFRTRDGGRRWRVIGAGFSALAIDPSNPARLYAGARSGAVQASADGGRNWHPLAALAAPIDDLVVDPVTPSTLYAATHGAGVLRSTDGGASWQPVNDGLTERGRLSIGRLFADPGAAHQFFAIPLLSQPGDLGSPGLFSARFPASP